MTMWPQSRLGDLFKIKHGFAFKGAHFSDEAGAVVLTPGNFEPSGGLKLRPGKDRSYKAAYPDAFKLKAGELLVVMTDLTQEAAILGAPAFIPDGVECLHNQRLGKIEAIDDARLDQRFLYYVLNSREYRERLKSTATGSTVKHTSPSRIGEHIIALPPLATQRRIASILGAYDDLIEVNRRRVAVLEEMARGLFEEWFVRFRFPGHESVPIVDAPDGPLPQGWERLPLGSACQIMRSGSTPYRKEPAYWENGVLDWFTTSELKNGFLFVAKERVSEKAIKDRKARIFPVGTVFIALYGATIGALGVAQVECSSNQAALGMVPDGSRMRQWQLFHTLAGLKDWFISVGQGAAQQNISKELVAGVKVALPPVSLSENFDRLVTPVWELRSVVEQQIERLATSRDLLLPRLISGQLSVEAAERQLEEAA